MKQLFVCCLFFSCYFGMSQRFENTITFGYDTAGNQVRRELTLFLLTEVEEVEMRNSSEIIEEDLLKFSPDDVISYYPNPVKEELFLKWDLINNNLVSKIEVYSLNGQLVKLYQNLEKVNTLIIPFQQYPSGTYSTLLFYTNGEQKSITIIKQ